MKREVIVTADGSKTIFIPEMEENYHSGHGALQEAIHVFIEHGLRHLSHKERIAVFEMGFGTGLNAFLTMIEAVKTGQQIVYEGIEAFPVEENMAIEMAYDQQVESGYSALFKEMHAVEWNVSHQLTDTFNFTKVHQKIEAYIPKNEQFDLIYFDAFGPRAQNDMWNPEILSKMYAMLKHGGILVTYCAKGQVKRDLKALGFTIEALPGPPGKREMTRAVKN
jgi:tRNA U34 5-methylaminomethyl-2-thiouridine-forming methyltransferase MnmC